jgi:uncharacterized membrane protein YgcG
MKRWIVVSSVVAAVALPGAAAGATFNGVVVSVQPARHSMAVAQANGVVRTVHARVLSRAGTRVTITASRLRDGTFGAARVSAFGRATRARIHGVVVRAVRGGYLISAGGSVLRILSPTRHTAATGTASLAPGTPVTATVSIGDDGLQAEDIEEVAQPVEVEPPDTEPAEPVDPVEPADNDQGEDQQGDDDQTTAAPPATTTTTDQNEGPGSTTSDESGTDGNGGSTGDGGSGGDG